MYRLTLLTIILINPPNRITVEPNASRMIPRPTTITPNPRVNIKTEAMAVAIFSITVRTELFVGILRLASQSSRRRQDTESLRTLDLLWCRYNFGCRVEDFLWNPTSVDGGAEYRLIPILQSVSYAYVNMAALGCGASGSPTWGSLTG